MESFSERNKYKPKKDIQFESIDIELRTGLWNVLTECFWERIDIDPSSSFLGGPDYIRQGPIVAILSAAWVDFFKKAKDIFPNKRSELIGILRSYFFEGKWFEIFDFMEFMAEKAEKSGRTLKTISKSFQDRSNIILDKECSAYRFINGKIVPVTNSLELNEINEVLTESIESAHVHIDTALQLYSDRQNPDYRNSIKESISGVESAAKHIRGSSKGDLNDALKIISKRYNLHPALKSAFEKLYAYTSDADGIRHAMMERPNLTSSDARFMLVICSAFVNYLHEIYSSFSNSQ